MTFAHRIKQEIINNKMSLQQGKMLVLGICYSIGYIKDDKYILKIKNSTISDLINIIIKKIGIDAYKSDQENPWIRFPISSFPNLIIPNKYISQFAGGLFIGGGSISDSSSSSYHLEIRINDKNKVTEIIRFFNEHKFNFNYIHRNTHSIIYIKKSDQISDFLRAIRSYGGVMEFEEFRISRDFKNNINRIANLEIHNQSKIATSSLKQIKIFRKLKKSDLYADLDQNYKQLIELKIENQFISIADLSDLYNQKYNVKTTKSMLNNWIHYLKNIKV